MPIAPEAQLQYLGPGFHFRYPVDWQVEASAPGDDPTVTVRPADDSTAFWSVTCLTSRPAPQRVLRTVLRAFEADYDELDSYPATEMIAGREAAGRDVEFVCLELTNTAFLRAVRLRDFTLLVLCQATDGELETCRDAFQLMTQSLACPGPLTDDTD